jgi:hypothetical protein
MIPNDVMTDLRNERFVSPAFLGNVICAPPLGNELFDLLHLSVSVGCVAHLDAASAVNFRVITILLRRHPLQITQLAILSVKIYMIDLWLVLWVWDKSHCNQAVDLEAFGLVVLVQMNREITAALLYGSRQQLARPQIPNHSQA